MADDETRSSREEFSEARRALVDMHVAQNPGLSYQDFNDVKIADFGTHAKTRAEQIAAADRESAARALNMTPDEFDAFKAQRSQAESTPEQRTANLPTGKTAPPPPSVTMTAPGMSNEPLTGIDLIEAQAAEDVATWISTGKWPRKITD